MMDQPDDRQPLLQPESAETTYNCFAEGPKGPINTYVAAESAVGANGDLSSASCKESEDSSVKLTRERWYILLAFSWVGFLQNLIWNTWGPIAVSSKFAFGWTDSTIALMANQGQISFALSAAFFSWLLYKSFRWSVVSTAFLLFASTGLRCITSSHPLATWLIYVGQFLNGMAGVVAMAGCPVLSALWFPAHQRTTATGLSSSLGLFGYATSFLLGPYLVPDVSNSTQTLCANASSQEYVDNHCDQTVHHIKSKIMLYMYIDFALCSALFLIVLLRFPSRPKFPPSLSASIERSPFIPSMKELIRHGRFWMLGIPYALSSGILGAWGSVLDINISPLGVSESAAGWMGFIATVAGQVVMVLVGLFADVFARRMKLFLLSLFSVSTSSFFLFALMCSRIIPFSMVALYVTNIVGNMGVFGATPLFYELACESAYPVAEGITNTFMTWLNNLMGLIFLSVLMIPAAGTAWMNWCLTGAVGICVPVFIFYRERYARLDIDTTEDQRPQAVISVMN